MRSFLSLAVFLSLAHSTLALTVPPTFEPLSVAKRSPPQVTRSLLAARLRRSAASRGIDIIGDEVPVNPKAVANPKKRSLDDAVVPNPKSKRSLANPKAKRSLDAPGVVSNPKTKAKRSLDTTAVVSNPKSKRSFASVPLNPKAKRSTAPLASPVAPKRRRNFLDFLSDMMTARQRLARTKARRAVVPFDAQVFKRQSTPFAQTTIGIISVVPNPKSNNFAPVVSQISSSLAATSTTSSATSTTTRAQTTTSRATTTTTSQSATTTSTATPTATSTSTTWPKSGSMIAAAYYPDWDATLLPPSKVDYSKFDLIDFAFALPQSDLSLAFDDSSSGATLKQVVKYAHAANTKVLISIGGWTDSTYFSKAVQSSTNRAKFITNIVALVNQYDLDGVDIDWEYPGGGGDSGNLVSSKDTANFLLFLQSLRAALGTDKRISACTTQQPFLGSNGSPLTDVSAFAAVLDNILVMNYDVWGASSTPGPNAPLSDACPNSLQPTANEESAIEIWTAAGMPASKILMGVPSYGYISASTAKTLVHKRDLPSDALRPRGVSNRERASILHRESQKSFGHRMWEEGQKKIAKRKAEKALKRRQVAELLKKRGTIIVCPNNHSGKPCEGITNQTIDTINWNPLNVTDNGNGTVTVNNGTAGVFPGSGVGVGKLGNGDLSSIDGNQIQFYQLISYGVIVRSGTSSTFTGVNGYTRKFDSCSSTPYLYNTARKVVITYDDPQSITLKAQLAKTKGIAGVNMWDISGDTDQWDLVNAYRAGMGLS